MHEILKKANELPDAWDALADKNPFLKKAFLNHMEKTCPQKMEYHLFFDDEAKLDSIMATYKTNNFPLFQNLRFKKKVKATLAYFIAPLSKESFVIGSKTLFEVVEFIKSVKGLFMIPNIKEMHVFKELPSYEMIPAVIMKNDFETFENYCEALRSDYRRRLNNVLTKSEDLKVKFFDTSIGFSKRMYSLYENVYRKADLTIEKLPFEYFKTDLFRLIVIYKDDIEIGFFQLCLNNDELIFELAGLDYSVCKEYDLYPRLLIELVRYAIKEKAKTIDFGQTAYDAKLRLGGIAKKRFIQGHHSIRLIHKFLIRNSNKLKYKGIPKTSYKVFKGEVK